MSRYVHDFNDQDALIHVLSQSILANLEDAIKAKGTASLVVSGGSTPKPLFEKLSQAIFLWEKVTVSLCDERWVDTSKEESNENFVQRYLLKDKARNARFIGLYQPNVHALDAENTCSNKLKKIAPFDVLVLGMGSDAHTASLFPNNEKLDAAYDLDREDLCISIEPEKAPHTRMSLTLKAILSAQHIYLHFEGDEKRAVFEKAIAGEDRYEMPIRSVLNQESKNIEVYYA